MSFLKSETSKFRVFYLSESYYLAQQSLLLILLLCCLLPGNGITLATSSQPQNVWIILDHLPLCRSVTVHGSWRRHEQDFEVWDGLEFNVKFILTDNSVGGFISIFCNRIACFAPYWAAHRTKSWKRKKLCLQAFVLCTFVVVWFHCHLTARDHNCRVEYKSKEREFPQHVLWNVLWFARLLSPWWQFYTNKAKKVFEFLALIHFHRWTHWWSNSLVNWISSSVLGNGIFRHLDVRTDYAALSTWYNMTFYHWGSDSVTCATYR